MWFYTLWSLYFFCGNTYDMSVVPFIIGAYNQLINSKSFKILVKHAKKYTKKVERHNQYLYSHSYSQIRLHPPRMWMQVHRAPQVNHFPSLTIESTRTWWKPQTVQQVFSTYLCSLCHMHEKRLWRTLHRCY